MKDLSEFTHKYSLSKTLRFALKPVGKTEEHIKTKGLLKQDKDRAEQYKKAKKIIDLYHKDFIEKSLNNVKFSLDDLQAFSKAYDAVKKDKKDKDAKKEEKKDKKDELSKHQERLRKIMVKGIEGTPEYKRLFKKELIQQDLPEWLKNHSDAKAHGLDRVSPQEYPKIIEEFEKWTTYFIGFHENRKNMYTSKSQATAIAHRIVHENLPKFLDNVEKWNRLLDKFSDIKKHFQEQFSALEQSMGIKPSSVFVLQYFSQCLNQSGIDIYNTILGGKSEKDGSKLQGINEIINLYRQQKEPELTSADDKQKENLRKDIKTLRGLKMQGLYKQILSDRESHSFLPEKFENDQALIDAINEFYQEISTNTLDMDGKNTSVLCGLQSCLKRLNNGDCDSEKIYVSNASLSDLSHACFKDWSMIRGALAAHAETVFPSKKDNPTKTELQNRETWIKNTKYFNLANLQTAIDEYIKTLDTDKTNEHHSIIQYFINGTIVDKKESENTETEIQVFHAITDTWDTAQDVLQAEYDVRPDKLNQEKDKVEKLKLFLDSVMQLLHFVKPLYIETNDKTDSDKKSSNVFDKDAAFYHDFDILYERLRTVTKLYNKVRDYLTRKKFKTEKYKLNFDKSTLLGGFVDSHTDSSDNATQYGAYLFRKKHLKFNAYEYYLGISEDVNLFRCHLKDKIQHEDRHEFERLEYYQPKSTTFFSSEYSNNKTKLVGFIQEKIKDIFDKKRNGQANRETNKYYKGTC